MILLCNSPDARYNHGYRDASADLAAGRPRKFMDGEHFDPCYLDGYNDRWDWAVRGGAGAAPDGLHKMAGGSCAS